MGRLAVKRCIVCLFRIRSARFNPLLRLYPLYRLPPSLHAVFLGGRRFTIALLRVSYHNSTVERQIHIKTGCSPHIPRHVKASYHAFPRFTHQKILTQPCRYKTGVARVPQFPLVAEGRLPLHELSIPAFRLSGIHHRSHIRWLSAWYPLRYFHIINPLSKIPVSHCKTFQCLSHFWPILRVDNPTQYPCTAWYTHTVWFDCCCVQSWFHSVVQVSCTELTDTPFLAVMLTIYASLFRLF